MSARQFVRWPVAAIALLAATSACATERARAIATSGAPAELAIAKAASLRRAPGAAYIEIVVHGYRPANDGAVQILVERLTRDSYVEIARFGLFPELAFSAKEPASAQRFSFPLDGPEIPGKVRIRLVPVSGNGTAAFADVAATIVRHR